MTTVSHSVIGKKLQLKVHRKHKIMYTRVCISTCRKHKTNSILVPTSASRKAHQVCVSGELLGWQTTVLKAWGGEVSMLWVLQDK